jgi:hypothetical protein
MMQPSQLFSRFCALEEENVMSVAASLGVVTKEVTNKGRFLCRRSCCCPWCCTPRGVLPQLMFPCILITLLFDNVHG